MWESCTSNEENKPVANTCLEGIFNVSLQLANRLAKRHPPTFFMGFVLMVLHAAVFLDVYKN